MRRGSSKGAMRARLLFFHRWLGFTAGVFFAIAAGTGAILVYADELDTILGGSRFQTTPGLIAPDEIQAAIHRHVPEGRLVRVIWPDDRLNVFQVRVTDGARQRNPVLDAGSGTLLEPREQHLVLRLIRRLHAGLLIGPVGGRIVQVASGVSLVTLAVGLILWWPGLRRLASGFRIRLGRGLYISNFDLHQALGVLALPLLIVMTVTGVLVEPGAMGFLSRLLHGAGPEHAWQSLRSSPPALPPPGDIDLATAVRMARREAPGAAPMQVAFAAGADGIVEVRMRDESGGARGASARIALDRYTGAVLLRQELRYSWEMNTRLHFGLAGGPVVRALYAVSCTIGFGLLPTGIAVWWIKRRRRGAPRVSFT